MWFDCEGNLRYAESSRFDPLLRSKIHDVGFTDVVVDVKSIMAKRSTRATLRLTWAKWDGVTRPENYDLLG